MGKPLKITVEDEDATETLEDMAPEKREALEASLERGLEEATRGEGIPAAQLLEELRARHK